MGTERAPAAPVVEVPTDRPLTAEERERGLHPRTLADLAFRPLAFASIAAGLAERDRKKKPKPKR